jgi:hypothetical protein
MWTTFTAKISAPGQPSFEYCNAQQIAPKTLYLGLRISGNPEKSNIPNFQKNNIK